MFKDKTLFVYLNVIGTVGSACMGTQYTRKNIEFFGETYVFSIKCSHFSSKWAKIQDFPEIFQ